uniref:Uncharacterized protein n=1 Tax=viral metagenome TaxID=1070528 RepID=A0A6C0FAG9_9ZZZZ
MPRKTIKRRRHVTKKGANIRRKKQQTKRVKNVRNKKGGASTGWASTYAPVLTKQVTTMAKGAELAQQAAKKLGENAETIDQLQTAFVAVQRQVDNQLAKFKAKKEEDLLKKFQKECGDKGPACVVEKQAEFFAKEQAESQRRTAANDAFWATLVKMDPILPTYTGLTNIELFTKIVDNWEEIETREALISAVQSYYRCPDPNTKKALLDCFKLKSNEVFRNAVDQFETKLHKYVKANLTGKTADYVKSGVTMAANAFRAAPGYAKTALRGAKVLSQQSKSSIEPAFEQVKTMMPQTHHQHIDKMKDFLLQLHDISSKLAGLQAEVSKIEEDAEEDAEEDSDNEFEDALEE